jgi:hypothetical protein
MWLESVNASGTTLKEKSASFKLFRFCQVWYYYLNSVQIGAAMSKVLMPLPSLDFDPTESAGSWLMLTEAGHRVNRR